MHTRPDLDATIVGQAGPHQERCLQLAAQGFGVDTLTLRPLAESL